MGLQSYEIRIRGRLASDWSDWFDGFSIRLEAGRGGDEVTVLSGPVIDSSALHGIVAKVRDLNLTLISINPIVPGGE